MSDEKLNMREETLCMKTRLERVALCADIASHYVQDMRVMPAPGVARVAWDAMDHINALEAKLSKAGRDLNVAKYGQPDFSWQFHVAAMTDLQARLAKAMEVVEMIASADVDAVLGQAVDISCEILGELMEDEDDE